MTALLSLILFAAALGAVGFVFAGTLLPALPRMAALLAQGFESDAPVARLAPVPFVPAARARGPLAIR